MEPIIPEGLGFQKLPHANLGKLSDADLDAIAADPDLQHITALDLSHAQLKGPQLQRLLASPHLTHLRALDLACNKQLGAAGAEALAAWPGRVHLHTLDLTLTGLSNKGLDLFLRGDELPHLRHLSLQNNRLSLKAIQALAARRTVLHLTHLDLSRNELDDACAERLASSHLDHLTHLDLGMNRFTDAGARLLTDPDRFGLKALQHLDLTGCFNLSDEACASLNALAKPHVEASN